MHLTNLFSCRVKLYCYACAFNQLEYINLTHRNNYYQCSKTFYHKLVSSNSNLPLVKEVMQRLSYSTNKDVSSKKNEGLGLDASDPAKSKKKKEIKIFITLLGNDGNMISVTTVEEATKLALRRNLRLVKELDLDPKSGRPVYKLISESDYLKGDKDWEDLKSKKDKDKSIKGNKLVSLSSSAAEHDVLIKTKMMLKWLEKRLEVRVVITGDLQKGENVFKIIEKEVGASGRIVQKRSKGQDIRFQILPPKKTEGAKTAKET